MTTPAITFEQAKAIGILMERLASVQENPPEPLYVSGVLNVFDGSSKIGELRTEEDWWVFIATNEEVNPE